MGEKYHQLNEGHIEFIKEQKLFFVATAGVEGRVNVSPKGMDSLRILGPARLVWLNLTGSGNETAAHVLESNRITLMYCAFTGKPMILRIYGKTQTLHPRDAEWSDYLKMFPAYPGARQIYIVEIESVITSCGFSVPLFEYQGDRDTLVKWAEGKGDAGVKEYQLEKNQLSIDKKPTKISE